MICSFKHGLNLQKLLEHINSMNIEKQIIYLNEYKSLVMIPLNDFNTFLKTRNKEILTSKNKVYVRAMLKLVGISIDPGLSVNAVIDLISSIKKDLIVFIDHVDNLINARNDIINNVIRKKIIAIDERKEFLGTEDQLVKEFELLYLKGYTCKHTKDELMLHFHCQDSSPIYDKEKAKDHRIIWKRAHNHFASWVNENIINGFFVDEHFKYHSFRKHIIPLAENDFNDLHKKYDNVLRARTCHKDIKDIVRQAKLVYSVKVGNA